MTLRRNPATLGLACALTAVVTGCATVGSTSTQDQPPIPSSYVAPDELDLVARESKSKPVQTLGPRWWTTFHSPELDRLVDQALSGSRTLEGARARLAAEQETLRAVHSSVYPRLTLNAGVTRQKESAASFGLPSNSLPLPPNFNLYELGLGAGYDSDLFGRISQRVAQQAAATDVMQRRLEATYLMLTGNTVSAAIQLAGARAQLEAQRQIEDIDSQTLQLVQRENAIGAVPDSDVVSAASQLAADQTLAPAIEQQISAARHALAVLLGRAPADWDAPALSLASMMLTRETPLIVPSGLVHQRPDILAAEAQLHAAAAQLGLATAALYPQITLSADITAESLTLRELFNPAGLVWSVAAGLTQPLFDAGMRRSERRAAVALLRASAADYQQTVLQGLQQVADLLLALSHDHQLAAAQQRSVEAASRSVALQRANYANGGAGLLQLLDAQRQYREALSGSVKVSEQQYLDTAALMVALGGSAGMIGPGSQGH